MIIAGKYRRVTKLECRLPEGIYAGQPVLLLLIVYLIKIA